MTGWSLSKSVVPLTLGPSFAVAQNGDIAARCPYHLAAVVSSNTSRPRKSVERGFGCEVDYGQISKTFATSALGKEASVRYSPAEVIGVKRTTISGMPDVKKICTSHIERQNLTLRMHCRRLTRLTNAFSKKVENFEAAVAMNFCYYNFEKTH